MRLVEMQADLEGHADRLTENLPCLGAESGRTFVYPNHWKSPYQPLWFWREVDWW